MLSERIRQLILLLGSLWAVAGCSTVGSASSGASSEVASHGEGAAGYLEEVSIPLKLKGRSGYLVFRPQIVEFQDAESNSSPGEAFRICDKIEIIRLVKYTHLDGKGWDDLLEIVQGKKTFFVSHVGTRGISRNEGDLKELIEELLESKPRLKKSGPINLASGKVDRRTAVCEQWKMFIGMTSSEALLVLGAPEKINRSVSRRGVREQWIYGSGRYFYFESNVLTGWQE